MPRIRPLAPLALIAVALSCTGGQASPSDVVTALCRANEAEEEGEARDVFYSEAHDGLHSLIDELMEEDRAAAASLLVTKNQVEAALGEGLPDAMIEARLEALIAETRTASEAVGRPAGEC